MLSKPEITLPICTAIVMAGLACLTYLRLGKKAIMDKDLAKEIKGKFGSLFVAKDDCAKKEVLLKLENDNADFIEIKKELKKQGTMLARIDERSLMWANANGHSKPKTKEEDDGES